MRAGWARASCGVDAAETICHSAKCELKHILSKRSASSAIPGKPCCFVIRCSPPLSCCLASAFACTSAGDLCLNEVQTYGSPSARRATQYLELRGPAGASIASGTYLVAVDGDRNQNPGTIDVVIDLSGQELGQQRIPGVARAGQRLHRRRRRQQPRQYRQRVLRHQRLVGQHRRGGVRTTQHLVLPRQCGIGPDAVGPTSTPSEAMTACRTAASSRAGACSIRWPLPTTAVTRPMRH